MRSTTKYALVASSALVLAFAAAGVTAQSDPYEGYGCAYGGPGYHMDYGMGRGRMGPGYGTGPGNGMGPGLGMGPGYGMGPGFQRGFRHGGPGYGGMGFGANAAGVDRGLQALQSRLGITDNQQPTWKDFTAAVRKQAENRFAWAGKVRQDEPPRTAPERLAQRSEAMKQHAADSEAVSKALGKLYDVLSPEQRATLDRGPLAAGPGYGWR